MPLVSEENVQAAFDYLNENANKAAMAKCQKVLTEHQRKQVRARLILGCEMKTQADKLAFAESHDDYIEACQAEADAYGADEFHRHQKARAAAVIDAWRTEQSTIRGTGKVA